MKSNATVKTQVASNRAIYSLVRRAGFILQLRERMIAKGIKSADIAERLGVSEANVSRWLKGKQNLQLDTLFSLADAVEEPLTILLGSDRDNRQDTDKREASKDGWSVSEVCVGGAVEKPVMMGSWCRVPTKLPAYRPVKSFANTKFKEISNELSAAAA